MKSRHVVIAPCAVVTILLGANVAAADPSTHRADYRVAYIGLPVARATFTTVFDGDRFTVAGEMQSAGVANIVGRTTGSTTVSGVKADDRMQAERYVVAYSSGDDEQRMEVDFDNGSVTSAILTPEKKRTREDWVPVPESDMRAVLDPIAGVMIRKEAMSAIAHCRSSMAKRATTSISTTLARSFSGPKAMMAYPSRSRRRSVRPAPSRNPATTPRTVPFSTCAR